MTDHSPDCDTQDVNLEGIRKPCNCPAGRSLAPATCSAVLQPSELEGTPEEIIKRLAGRELPPTNGWGRGVVVGAWILRRRDEEPHVRLLLASPNANNPVLLFNEDARYYLPNPERSHGDKT